jgi:hypothetical protein
MGFVAGCNSRARRNRGGIATAALAPFRCSDAVLYRCLIPDSRAAGIPAIVARTGLTGHHVEVTSVRRPLRPVDGFGALGRHRTVRMFGHGLALFNSLAFPGGTVICGGPGFH